MWRGVSSFIVALFVVTSAASAQQPCTTDARKVVDELYRHMLERSADLESVNWVGQLQNGRMTVRDLVREIAKSPEHNQRFIRQEAGEETPYIRSVNRLYRHILGRQPDPAGARGHAQIMARDGVNAVIEAFVNSAEYTQQYGDWGVPGSGGINFCPPASRQTSNRPAPNVQASNTDTRFRGMDRNNDGVITQDEWQGSRQSFRVHDWDGNGVLSGDEIRAGAVRQGRTIEDENFDRDDQFGYLDVNGNNRIERREWHGSDDAFDWLDRDNNNVLTRAEMGANVNANASRAPVGTSGDQVFVNPAQEWTDTGINMRAGELVIFNAEGSVQLSDNANDTATPSGSRTGRRAANAPVRQGPAGGLIARIGNGGPVYVGANGSLRARDAGRLYLGVNDDFFGDNTGEYRVTITIQDR